MDTKDVTAKSLTLVDPEDGRWIGQIAMTNDGMLSGVTDYGNFAYAWRAYGDDFGKFILRIEADYFATKLETGMAYTARPTKQTRDRVRIMAERILPLLKSAIRSQDA